ncbi:MAG: ArsC/Spx/MgsR family protein, partial [Gammaproteobacteria bacterium]
QTPVDAAGLKELLTQMQIPVRTLLRTNNDTYRALKLDDQSLSEQRLIEQIAAHPELMQRPIVVTPKGTRICRPPEKVLEIL